MAVWSANPFVREYRACLVLVPEGKQPSRRFKGGAVDEATEMPEGSYGTLVNMAVQRNLALFGVSGPLAEQLALAAVHGDVVALYALRDLGQE